MWCSTVGIIITFALSLLWGPLPTGAQRLGKSPRIGILHLGAAADSLSEAFEQGLRDLGYVEGQNLVLEYRFAAGQFERLPALAAELVSLPVDVLVVPGLEPSLPSTRPRPDDDRLRMRLHNADGSASEISGNGVTVPGSIRARSTIDPSRARGHY